ncbi:nucleoside deaminase [Nocardia australiensis]|uniref:nucleoside deaminase n=1 Tax=Nocardia australiensis TaxID=2887191 RepID=UPI001D1583A0|nr:nucleoside deaminase [Nocardia australiensis]
MLTDVDLRYLDECVVLATEALDSGNAPFGSLLVVEDRVVATAKNEVATGDPTRHPEFELARWGAQHLAPTVRAHATVYTSGEHCPMCSAAHAWAGLGRIVFAASAQQLAEWRQEMGVAPGPVLALPIAAIAPEIEIAGPALPLADKIRALHLRHAERSTTG